MGGVSPSGTTTADGGVGCARQVVVSMATTPPVLSLYETITTATWWVREEVNVIGRSENGSGCLSVRERR